MFRSMDEMYNEMLERNRRLLAYAEEAYYRDFSRAIAAIHHAYTDLVCFGEKEVWFGDMLMESDLQMAIHTEHFYKKVKQQYDEALRLVEGSVS